MATTSRPSVTLHSSWRGLVGGLAGPLILLVIAALAVAGSGLRPLSTAIGIVGLVLLAVVLFDFPVATRIDGDGVERRMLLRRHHLPFGSITQLTRTRPKMFSTVRHDSASRQNRGGLVAMVGRRRYLLVDQGESRAEFERLDDVLGEFAPQLRDEALRPPEEANPTFLYRRRQWGLDEQRDR